MRVKAFYLYAILSVLSLGLAAQQQPATTALQVTQAQLGTGVANRELTGAATTFPVGSKVYLWLEVTGGPSSSPITVAWKNGQMSHTAQLDIGGPRWRTWAVKTLGSAGAWTVTVTGPDGKVLKDLTFTAQ